MDKAQGELAARLAEARQEATAAAGGEALVRNGQLEADLAEQSLQVCSARLRGCWSCYSRH